MTCRIKFAINLSAELSSELHCIAALSTEGTGVFSKVDKHIMVNNRGTFMYCTL